MEVVEEHTNNLLGRREAKLVVHHEGAGTPDRLTVRKLASEHFKAPVDRVFVRSIATRTGGSSATCMVEIYTSNSNPLLHALAVLADLIAPPSREPNHLQQISSLPPPFLLRHAIHPSVNI